MSQGIDAHALDLATEQTANWQSVGCNPSECLSLLGVADDLSRYQHTWLAVHLATYEAAQRFA